MHMPCELRCEAHCVCSDIFIAEGDACDIRQMDCSREREERTRGIKLTNLFFRLLLCVSSTKRPTTISMKPTEIASRTKKEHSARTQGHTRTVASSASSHRARVFVCFFEFHLRLSSQCGRHCDAHDYSTVKINGFDIIYLCNEFMFRAKQKGETKKIHLAQ